MSEAVTQGPLIAGPDAFMQSIIQQCNKTRPGFQIEMVISAEASQGQGTEAWGDLCRGGESSCNPVVFHTRLEAERKGALKRLGDRKQLLGFHHFKSPCTPLMNRMRTARAFGQGPSVDGMRMMVMLEAHTGRDARRSRSPLARVE
ncbi:hypothetical protein DNTS_024597 [Danionella cerebrum]|uniref:Uncharacterized protein n=1 Tax=Danionella cerebrum TaxID=2873325 RepID=A0A553NHH5_9TELE|nr:hypothetical protein DNTS_024597 [Danionella translucida]